MNKIRIRICKEEIKCSCCKEKIKDEFGYFFHEDCFEKIKEEKCKT